MGLQLLNFHDWAWLPRTAAQCACAFVLVCFAVRMFYVTRDHRDRSNRGRRSAEAPDH